MYSLLIVEDEEIIREGMKYCLDWAALGIGTIMEASDGESALAIAKEAKPDLVLTDVVMSVMDGIEFVARLRRDIQDKHIHVIMISGHENVDYIKSALKLQVVDYVLKPFHTEELEHVVRKAMEAIADEREKAARLSELEKAVTVTRSMIKERFMQDVLFGSDISLTDTYRELLDEWLPQRGAYRAFYMEGVRSAEAAERLRQQLPVLGMLPLNEGVYGGVISSEEMRPFACLEGMATRIGLGSRVEQLDAVHLSFQHARLALVERTREAELAEPHAALQIVPYEAKLLDRERLLVEAGQCEEAIIRQLEAGDREQLAGTVRRYVEVCLAFGGEGLPYLQAFGSMLLIRTKQHYAVLLEKQEPRRLEQALELVRSARSPFELEALINSALDEMGDIVRSKPEQRKLVRAVTDYVEQSLREELTLAHIAARVHLSPNYLAHLFKKETGTTLNDYVTSVRMEEAKRLLREEPGLLVLELAERVGYADSKYFTRLFKREVGINPSEYREKLR
ncbi:response regulator [Paenibacillus thalictri]|uniref:Response regulator n=1 Tax=Paenibacillus thalictri TaxID=2527873 RepID=A0A4Q9DMY8_9BACL|nr:response regulator [Paenibacillus thalictri]TBL74558.1 response regulator [Paenibacillus thalictri]